MTIYESANAKAVDDDLLVRPYVLHYASTCVPPGDDAHREPTQPEPGDRDFDVHWHTSLS